VIAMPERQKHRPKRQKPPRYQPKAEAKSSLLEKADIKNRLQPTLSTVSVKSGIYSHDHPVIKRAPKMRKHPRVGL